MERKKPSQNSNNQKPLQVSGTQVKTEPKSSNCPTKPIQPTTNKKNTTTNYKSKFSDNKITKKEPVNKIINNQPTNDSVNKIINKQPTNQKLVTKPIDKVMDKKQTDQITKTQPNNESIKYEPTNDSKRKVVNKVIDHSNETTFSIFSYGTLRKDYIGFKDGKFLGDHWNATEDAEAEYGYIPGFKLYQRSGIFYPFICPSDDENDRVFGTILTWKQFKFKEATERCNRIEGYNEKDNEHGYDMYEHENLFERATVKVYKDKDLTIFDKFAQVYYQPHENLRSFNESIKGGEIIAIDNGFDWFKFPGVDELRSNKSDQCSIF